MSPLGDSVDLQRVCRVPIALLAGLAATREGGTTKRQDCCLADRACTALQGTLDSMLEQAQLRGDLFGMINPLLANPNASDVGNAFHFSTRQYRGRKDR